MMDKNEKWIIGEPGGPSGPFYSVVSSSGRLIAGQIPDEETAKLISSLPELISASTRCVQEVWREDGLLKDGTVMVCIPLILFERMKTATSQLEKTIPIIIEQQLKTITPVIEFLRDQIIPQIAEKYQQPIIDTIYALKEFNYEKQKEKNVKLGGKCRVTAKEGASKRTKERIGQHQQPFTISKRDYGKNKILLVSEDGWFGWLPINEINIDILEGN